MAEKTEKNGGFHGVGVQLNESFRRWWSTARLSEEPPSPYDLLVNLGLKPALAQKVFWEVIEQTMADVCPPDGYELEDACWNNFVFMGPGAIDYFARQFLAGEAGERGPDKPPKHESYARMLENSLRYFWSHSGTQAEGAPTEQDIRSLALLANKASGENGHFGQDAICLCLRYEYSAELLHFLIDQLPLESKFSCKHMIGTDIEYHPDPLRQAMDHHCMLGFQKIFNKVKSVELLETNWTKVAFMQCLCMLLKGKELKEVKLLVPRVYVEDTSDDTKSKSANQDLALSSLLTSEKGNSSCEIEKLCLQFQDTYKIWQPDPKNPCPGLPLAMESVFCMPRLKTLRLELAKFVLEVAHPYLLQAIQNNSLCSLSIEVSGAPPSVSWLVALLGALKDNTAIAKFHYIEGVSTDIDLYEWSYSVVDIEEEHLEVYESKLLQLLQEGKNSTLTDVQFSSNALGEKIKYYLALNRYGRGLARDPQSQLIDFVSQLHSVDDQVRRLPEHRDRNPYRSGPNKRSFDCTQRSYDCTLIHYGLLRESPGSWSSQLSHPSKRMRKS